MRKKEELPKLREFPIYPKLDEDKVTLDFDTALELLIAVQGIFRTPGIEIIQGTVLRNMPKFVRDISTTERDPNAGLIVQAHAALSLFSFAFGLAGPGLEKQKPEWKIYTADRFQDLVDLLQGDENLLNGATIGSHDPPHLFQALHQRALYPYVDRVLVGTDPDWLIKRRKGENRPRFPHLLYRMWQFAILPTTFAVFEIPIEKNDDPNTFFPWLWDQLNIKALHTEPNHEHIKDYRRQMTERSGHVLTTRRMPWLINKFINIRSSSNVARLAKRFGSEERALKVWNKKMEKRERIIKRKVDNFIRTNSG